MKFGSRGFTEGRIAPSVTHWPCKQQSKPRARHAVFSTQVLPVDELEPDMVMNILPRVKAGTSSPLMKNRRRGWLLTAEEQSLQSCERLKLKLGLEAFAKSEFDRL